jgi:DNA-binding CsgD family transcriptional regulator
MNDEQRYPDQTRPRTDLDGHPIVAGRHIAPVHLTPRESQIVQFVVLGESNKQIARRLGISDYTVRDHVSNLLRKAGATKRSRLGSLLPTPAIEVRPAARIFERSGAAGTLPKDTGSGQTGLRPTAGTL